MPMKATTFVNKLSDAQPSYSFTDAEYNRLIEILRDGTALLETVIGISFNKALATIVNK
jgi:hypothetical protein